MDIAIQPMQSRDVEQVRALGLRTPRVWTGNEEFYDDAALREWATSPLAVARVARDGERVVGFTLASVLPHSREAYSHATVVAPGYEHHGIGSGLLLAADEELARRGCRKTWGITAVDNLAMRRMQEELGWRKKDGEFLYYERRPLRRDDVRGPEPMT